MNSSVATIDIAVITGAAGNVGRSAVRRFRDGGARVVAVDTDADTLRNCYADDADVICVATDLVDPVRTSRELGAVVERLGPAAALCNIAGGFDYSGDAHAVDGAVWQRMFDMNVATLVNACRVLVPAMIAAGRGRIVNVSAASATTGKAGMAPYCAAKSAVARITESMSMELRDRGINVNAVAPSILDTPANRQAMPDADAARWVTAPALADVIHFLASDAAAAIHGAILPVVGRV